MAKAAASVALSSNTWTELHTYGEYDKAVEHSVAVLSGTGTVEVYVAPLHGSGPPDAGTEGFVVRQGETRGFIERTERGSGAIGSVWARSTDAVISHGATIG